MQNYQNGDLVILNSGKAVIIDEILEDDGIKYYGSDDDGKEYVFSENQVLALSAGSYSLT